MSAARDARTAAGGSCPGPSSSSAARLARRPPGGATMTSVLLVGAGAVGARAARQLVEADDVDEVVIVDPNGSRREAVVASPGDKAVDGRWGAPVPATDTVRPAGPRAPHVDPTPAQM